MPELNDITKILANYPAISLEEEIILNEWLKKSPNEEFFQAVTDNENRITLLERLEEMTAQEGQMWEKFHTKNFANTLPQKARTLWWRSWPTYVAAASIIVIAWIGLKWWETKKNGAKVQLPAAIAEKNDIKPGGFKATLTLDDGSVMELDSFSKGRLVQQGSTDVYNKEGKLIYEPRGKHENKVIYNTLTTAKGQIYATVLADGSKVWLNSESSIRYPVSFSQDRREVEITGEAYFEVSKQKIPFIVKGEGVEIEVLGTHFNVNSYKDENTIKTTLLEGKVKVHVTSNGSVAILQPGQQAIFRQFQEDKIKLIENADIDEAVAWHYGYFQFGRVNLKTVLQQLVRWYDVDVEYRGNIPDRAFGGKISRNNRLLQVLGTLESNDVHFRLEGRKIIVSP